MASSAFSFHCMICFEEFDPQTNYPVVLPCGHTYVCIECANRLDKCMECRTPLTMKMECPPAPPPPVTTPGRSTGSPAIGGGGGVGSGSGQSSSQDGSLKENQANRYADRVRNSPGFRRRYGDSQREDYRNNKRHPQQHQSHQHQSQQQQQQHPPPLPIPKQRLPLPKNAVLLSLIQASEPARRRAEVEAPPTPQKVEDNNSSCLNTIQVGSETPSPGNRGGTGGGGGGATSSFNTLPKFTRPSPLFLDGSSSGEFETNNNTNTNSHTTTHHHHHHTSSTSSGLVGSQPDDEEHKIRVGTYLEGGPCGTYAVAVKSGLLVYPTLFEHTLPSALNGLTTRKNKNNNNTTNQNNNGDNDDEDLMKRNVEELVKQHRARTFTTQQQKEKDLQQQQQSEKRKMKKNSEKRKKKDANNTDIIDGEKGKETTAPEQESASTSPLHHQNDNILENNSTTTNNSSSSTTSPLHTELGISHTWEDENLEVQVASIRPLPSASLSNTMVLKPKKPHQSPTTLLLYPQDSTSSSCSGSSSSSTVTSPQGTSIIMNDNDNDDTTTTNNNNNGIFGEQGESTTSRCMEKMTAASDPGTGTGGLMSTSALMGLASLSEDHDENDDVGLAVSLTISISDEDDTDNNIGDLLANSVRTMPTKRSQSVVGVGEQRRSTSPLSASHRVPTTTSSGNTKDVATKFVRHFSQGYNVNNNNNNNNNNKNGNHHTNKTKKSISDSASSPTNNNNNSNGIMDEFERPLIRLKYGDRVQVVSMDSRGWVKLARGYGYIRLENDKQLVKVGGTSDKACQIEAMLHELSLERNRLKHEQMKLERLAAGLMIDLQSSLITSDDHVVVSAPMLRTDSEASLLNIDVSTRSRTALTPPRSMESTSNHQPSINHQHPHREIRTAKSHSPGRTTLPSTKTPPSPPYGQVTPNPTSQNLATINTPTRVNFRTGMSGHRALTSSLSHPHDFIGQGNIRSMSNHSGISSTKKPSSRGRSIY